MGRSGLSLTVATDEARETVNHSALSLLRQTENLLVSAKLCATWIQTCMLNYANKGDVGLVSEGEQAAYLVLINKVLQQASLQGVMLYTLARPSLQPEVNRLSKVTEEQINNFAQRIRQSGLPVTVSL